MTTGPQDPAAAGGDRLRAGHADREQVIEARKDAFVQGRLTRDELDVRAGRALAARTRAELAALAADIPAVPAAPAGPVGAGPVAAGPARRRPLARAAAGSGGCLVIAFAAVRVAFIFDPGGAGPDPYHSWARPFMLLAVVAVLTALGIVVLGVATSVEQRGAPAGSCRPGRGRAATPSKPDGAAAPAMTRFPRPPHRPDPLRRPAGSQVTAARSGPGGPGTP